MVHVLQKGAEHYQMTRNRILNFVGEGSRPGLLLMSYLVRSGPFRVPEDFFSNQITIWGGFSYFSL
jgi:hypothetical protein